MEARDERRLRALQKHLSTVKLLIVDELGYVPFTAVGSELLFEVFSQRYQRGATVIVWAPLSNEDRRMKSVFSTAMHQATLQDWVFWP